MAHAIPFLTRLSRHDRYQSMILFLWLLGSNYGKMKWLSCEKHQDVHFDFDFFLNGRNYSCCYRPPHLLIVSSTLQSYLILFLSDFSFNCSGMVSVTCFDCTVWIAVMVIFWQSGQWEHCTPVTAEAANKTPLSILVHTLVNYSVNNIHLCERGYMRLWNVISCLE